MQYAIYLPLFMEHTMTIYQVVDEQNHLVYAFMSLQTAKEEVEMLNESREDHFYYVNELEFQFEES